MARNHGGTQIYLCIRCRATWGEHHPGIVPVPRVLSAMCLPCAVASLDRALVWVVAGRVSP